MIDLHAHHHPIKCRTCPHDPCADCGSRHDPREPCLRATLERHARELAERLAYERADEVEL